MQARWRGQLDALSISEPYFAEIEDELLRELVAGIKLARKNNPCTAKHAEKAEQ